VSALTTDSPQRRMFSTTAYAGPLTSIWTGGINCLQTYTSAAGAGFVATYSIFFGHWGSYDPGRTCYPPAEHSVDVGAVYYFSPAVCPQGWVTACSFTGYSDIPSSVTASLCCPRYEIPVSSVVIHNADSGCAKAAFPV
jgi:hypothetical protein